jgi:hypothetical protein
MSISEHPSDTKGITPKRQRLTVFVSHNTLKRLETLGTIYEAKPGRIIDKLVYVLWSSRATKALHCITGKGCQFQLAFPETEPL